MLKTNNNFYQRKLPLALALLFCSSLALFSYLTFIPARAFAADEGIIVDPNEHRTLSSITSMQQMSQQICINSAENESKQLYDTRDGKSYWVTKLADGNCWMTQNLDYNIKAGDFTGAVATRTGDINSGWSDTQTAVQSWDPGTYYYKYVSASDWTNCGSPVSNMSGCPSKGNWSTTAPAAEGEHYHVGNYYSWNAATAGTGGSITSGEASASICPTNWKLPTSNNTAKGSFGYLMGQYGLRTDNGAESNVDKVRLTPLYFIPAGGVATDGLRDAGNYGLYWSSSPYSNGIYAYNLDFRSGNLSPSSYSNRYLGRSVRCLATGGWLPPETNYANVAINVAPVISIDATSGMNEEVDFTTVANGDISATITSNQPYQVLLSTDQTTLEQNPVVAGQNIPMITADSNIVAGTKAWGIKKTLSATTGGTAGDTTPNTSYSPIGTSSDKVLFYKSANAESKQIVFPVAIAVDATIASGTYSTQVTITAVVN